MKTKLLKVLLLVTTIVLTSCSDNNEPQDQLPPITQTGANTFGCVINGKVLIPKDGRGVPQPKGLVAYRRPNGNFVINVANLRDVNGDRIYIYIYNLTSTGTYNFNLSDNQSDITFSPNYSHCWLRTYESSIGGKFYLSNENSGKITVTRFDPNNYIISGTFNLTAFNKENQNDKIKITKGRFDINWSTL